MPPSQLSIATSSLIRLVKEEKSYHTEMKAQERRIKLLEEASARGDAEAEDEEGNRDFGLRQEKKALQETILVMPKMREKITLATEKLESLLPAAVVDVGADEDLEVVKAREAVRSAKEVQAEVQKSG